MSTFDHISVALDPGQTVEDRIAEIWENLEIDHWSVRDLRVQASYYNADTFELPQPGGDEVVIGVPLPTVASIASCFCVVENCTGLVVWRINRLRSAVEYVLARPAGEFKIAIVAPDASYHRPDLQQRATSRREYNGPRAHQLPPRQRAATVRRQEAARAAEQAAILQAVQSGPSGTQSLDWRRSDGFWLTADGRLIAIHELTDKQLWQALIWAVRNAGALYRHYAEPVELAFNNPQVWLAGRPLLRSLVYEASLRGLTFPNDVFGFLRDYLLEGSLPSVASQPTPWRDPNLLDAQFATMQQLRETCGPDARITDGKEQRNINL